MQNQDEAVMQFPGYSMDVSAHAHFIDHFAAVLIGKHSTGGQPKHEVLAGFQRERVQLGLRVTEEFTQKAIDAAVSSIDC
jgi:hypothetical protein